MPSAKSTQSQAGSGITFIPAGLAYTSPMQSLRQLRWIAAKATPRGRNTVFRVFLLVVVSALHAHALLPSLRPVPVCNADLLSSMGARSCALRSQQSAGRSLLRLSTPLAPFTPSPHATGRLSLFGVLPDNRRTVPETAHDCNHTLGSPTDKEMRAFSTVMRNNLSAIVSDVPLALVDSPTRFDFTRASLEGVQGVQGVQSPGEKPAAKGSSVLTVSVLRYCRLVGVLSFSILVLYSLATFAASACSSLCQAYGAMALSYPVPTKSLTSGIAYLIGDAIAQKWSSRACPGFDKGRLMRATLAGAISHGPQLHFWTVLMDESRLPLLGKIALDQTFFSLYINAAFCIFTEALQGHSLGSAISKAKASALPCLLAGWKFWPLAHVLTYSIIPLHLRVLWVDVLEVAWVAILSTCVAGRAKTTPSDAQGVQQAVGAPHIVPPQIPALQRLFLPPVAFC